MEQKGGKKGMKKDDLQAQIANILEQAERTGAKGNFFFRTTFERYQTQLKIMSDLKKEIEKDGAIVTKEYVKGRQNVYTHPAIGEYNKTATAANGTVATLINIVKSFSDEETHGSKLQGLIDSLNE